MMTYFATPMPDPQPEHVVHVLTVEQDDPDVRARLPNYRTLLSDDERTREARFYFDADKERFVIGRALTRLQLSRFLGGDPRSWPLVTNRYGRPELATPAPIGFNVSHTQGLVACAVAGTTDVGVDVEFIDRRLTHDVADRFFAPSEVADLRRLDPDEQARVFFDYWTLKEAYIKARGMGLALPLAHFAFSLRPPDLPTIRFDAQIDDDASAWQFAQSWPTGRHRLGLAVRRPPGRDLEVRIRAVVPSVPA
jgi:4'-phosphopantetheinyl transferase